MNFWGFHGDYEVGVCYQPCVMQRLVASDLSWSHDVFSGSWAEQHPFHSSGSAQSLGLCTAVSRDPTLTSPQAQGSTAFSSLSPGRLFQQQSRQSEAGPPYFYLSIIGSLSLADVHCLESFFFIYSFYLLNVLGK